MTPDIARCELVLIRGIPGSGKTTIAKTMRGFEHYEADMFFERDGAYCFDKARIADAHEWCLSMAKRALFRGANCVIANTFTRAWEMAPYQKAAEFYGASFRIIEATGRFINVHGVPSEIVNEMAARFERLKEAA